MLYINLLLLFLLSLKQLIYIYSLLDIICKFQSLQPPFLSNSLTLDYVVFFLLSLVFLPLLRRIYISRRKATVFYRPIDRSRPPLNR